MQMASAIVEEDETDELPEPLQAEHPLSISRQVFFSFFFSFFFPFSFLFILFFFSF